MGDNYLCTPVRHLTPWQYVTHEGFSHQSQIDQHTEDPDQLTWLLVGTVQHSTHHVQVYSDKEEGSASGVHVTQQPAPFNITHDVFNGSESAFSTWHIVHRQNAEEVPEVKVLRSIVLGHMLFIGLSNRQTIVNPAHQSILVLAHQAFSSSTPTTITLTLLYI